MNGISCSVVLRVISLSHTSQPLQLSASIPKYQPQNKSKPSKKQTVWFSQSRPSEGAKFLASGPLRAYIIYYKVASVTTYNYYDD